MRKLVLMMSMSLDGYFEGPQGQLDWHLVDDELHRHFNDYLGSMSAFLNGRRTYEVMSAYWPTADEDPCSTAPMVEFAGIWREMPKLVFSRTLQQADWNTTVHHEVVEEEIVRLKAQPGGDMVLGGPDLAASFSRLKLIDEYRIYLHPVVIGGGRPLFPLAQDRTALQLVEHRAFGNGVVLLRYR